MSDSEKQIPLTINEQKGIERLGRDNVSSILRGLFEIHNNGLWACDKAERADLYPPRTEPVIDIELTREDGRLILTYRDNGIGMNEYDLKNKYTKIAENTNPEPDTTSLFGIGVLAILNTVGFYSGEVLFETRKRTQEENNQPVYTCSLSYNDGLTYTETSIENSSSFERGEYGTEYTLYLTDEMSISQITDWIENISMLNPRKIVYTNSLAENTQIYPKKSLTNTEELSSEQPISELTVDEFQRLSSQEYLTKTTIFDGLVEIGLKQLNYNNQTNLFLNTVFVDKRTFTFNRSRIAVDVNVNSEVPLVADPESQHFKKQVVLEGKLDQLENPDEYVAESNLSDDTIITPRLIGNREDFVISNEFISAIEEKINTLCDQYTTQFENKLQNHNVTEVSAIEYFINKPTLRYHADSQIALPDLFKTISVTSDKYPELESLNTIFELYTLTHTRDVPILFTLGRESKAKRDAALEDGYTLAQLTAQGYPSDPEKSFLGWETVIDNYDSVSSSSTNSDKITVHYFDNDRNKTTYTSYTLDKLNYLLNTTTHKFDTLYVFAPDSKENLSDWKKHTGIQKNAFANVSQEQFENLITYPTVSSAEELITVQQDTVTSVSGETYTLQDLQDEDIICIGYTSKTENMVKGLQLEERWSTYNNINVLSKQEPEDFCYLDLKEVYNSPLQYTDLSAFDVYVPTGVIVPDGFSAYTLERFNSKGMLYLLSKYWSDFSSLSQSHQQKFVEITKTQESEDVEALDKLFDTFVS